jgi:hypothetical protein
VLDVIAIQGRTTRETTFLATLDCSETYPERDMTADDLRGVDLADDSVTFDDEDMLTTRNGSVYQWMPE